MSTLPDEVHGRLLDTLSWIGRLRRACPAVVAVSAFVACCGI